MAVYCYPHQSITVDRTTDKRPREYTYLQRYPTFPANIVLENTEMRLEKDDFDAVPFDFSVYNNPSRGRRKGWPSISLSHCSHHQLHSQKYRFIRNLQAIRSFHIHISNFYPKTNMNTSMASLVTFLMPRVARALKAALHEIFLIIFRMAALRCEYSWTKMTVIENGYITTVREQTSTRFGLGPSAN